MRHHGCVADPTDQQHLEWVDSVCHAVETIHDPRGSLSIHDVFERASADLSEGGQFLVLVSECLRTHPELVQQWDMFSSDTRATSWPYFSLDRLEVGFVVSVNGASEDVRRWENGPDACADYLHRAFKWVLLKER